MTNERMPGPLRLALILLVLQVVANGYGGFLIQDEIDDRLDHGLEVANLNLVNAAVYLSYGLAAVLLATIVFLVARKPWAQYPVYVIEALAIAVGLVLMVVAASAGGVLGLAIAVVVLIGVSRSQVTEWLDPEPDDDVD
jgi:hypothetical protein